MDAKIAALGLDAETTAKVEGVLKDILKDNYVSLTRFNEVNDAKKNLETTVAERDAQIEELGNSKDASDDLKKQIETLKAKNISDKKAYDESIKQMKTDKYINDILMENGVLDAKYIPAVKAYLPNVNIDSEDSKTVFLTKLGEVKSTTLPSMFKQSEDTSKTSIEGFHPNNPDKTTGSVQDDGSYGAYLKIHGYTN